ncbi:MAG: CsbD family protein [Simkaniaceae bacterium]|nr:CsbD family protein [Simkaniaceae bacterium]
MNQDKFEGRWKELQGKIKEKWGKLTDDDMMRINGKYEQFLGALQKRYGYEKERAEKEFNSWHLESERDLKKPHESGRGHFEDRDMKNKDRDDHKRRKVG